MGDESGHMDVPQSRKPFLDACWGLDTTLLHIE